MEFPRLVFILDLLDSTVAVAVAVAEWTTTFMIGSMLNVLLHLFILTVRNE